MKSVLSHNSNHQLMSYYPACYNWTSLKRCRPPLLHNHPPVQLVSCGQTFFLSRSSKYVGAGLANIAKLAQICGDLFHSGQIEYKEKHLPGTCQLKIENWKLAWGPSMKSRISNSLWSVFCIQWDTSLLFPTFMSCGTNSMSGASALLCVLTLYLVACVLWQPCWFNS